MLLGTFDGHGRRHEARAVEVVELGGNVARQLDMLELVLANGHVSGPEEQNVGRLQHRIGEQAERRVGESTVGRLVLELVHARQLRHCHLAAEYPAELAVIGHLRLLVEYGALRVDAAREQSRRAFINIVTVILYIKIRQINLKNNNNNNKVDQIILEQFRLLWQGDGMQVDDGHNERVLRRRRRSACVG